MNLRPVRQIMVAAIFVMAAGVVWPATVTWKTLRGHVPSVVAKLSAVGTLPGTNRLHLAIGLPLRDPAGLDVFLAQLADPASTNYRHYLTPGQFTERFGPTAADYAAVTQFAATNGLTVTATHGNRLLLDVSGTAADIQRAFRVTLRKYHHPTEARDFYAPDSEPSVTVDLPVADISGLSDYSRPHPMNLRADTAIQAGAVPRSGSGSGGAYMGNDFRAAYLPGVTLTGAGQQVGLVQFDGFYSNDITSYETAAGLPAVPLQTVLLDGYDGTPSSGANSGDVEVSLDIEMCISMAPGLAGIVLFEAGPYGTPNDILNSMVASNSVKQLSCSWGWNGGPSTTTDNIFKQMAADGQSFFNAAGDDDAFTVGSGSVNGVDNTSLATTPASSPYITQVGGTTLTTSGAGGSWVSEKVWNWNYDSAIPGYAGSCGGVSSYYAIPAWQTNVSMSANGGSTSYRNIPDVAMTADNVLVDYNNGSSATLGGTSCATPLWAAFAALVNQQAVAAGKAPVGFINPAIYALGTGGSYTSLFHDINTGSNCWPSSPSSYFAVTGYDLCTGWGTPAGPALINALAGTIALGVSPLTGAANGTAGGPFTITAGSFTLTNNTGAALAWSLVNTSAWLKVSGTNGTLAAAAQTNLACSLTATASNLLAGTYATSLVISNHTAGATQAAVFTLLVNSPLTVSPTNGFGFLQQG